METITKCDNCGKFAVVEARLYDKNFCSLKCKFLYWMKHLVDNRGKNNSNIDGIRETEVQRSIGKTKMQNKKFIN